MADTGTRMGLQIRSTVKKEGIVEISLARVATASPNPTK